MALALVPEGGAVLWRGPLALTGRLRFQREPHSSTWVRKSTRCKRDLPVFKANIGQAKVRAWFNDRHGFEWKMAGDLPRAWKMGRLEDRKVGKLDLGFWTRSFSIDSQLGQITDLTGAGNGISRKLLEQPDTLPAFGESATRLPRRKIPERRSRPRFLISCQPEWASHRLAWSVQR